MTNAITAPAMSAADVAAHEAGSYVRPRPAARLAESLGDADAARCSSGVTALRGKTSVATAIKLAVA
ncbi:hypothetical protein AB0O20_06515 [Streptomyces kronopolitis]|uniref:hypothetical protein n=1 Tax=Streptomyces kronopolitis TaxID=1612435 RepID=UPI0034246B7F